MNIYQTEFFWNPSMSKEGHFCHWICNFGPKSSLLWCKCMFQICEMVDEEVCTETDECIKVEENVCETVDEEQCKGQKESNT